MKRNRLDGQGDCEQEGYWCMGKFHIQGGICIPGYGAPSSGSDSDSDAGPDTDADGSAGDDDGGKNDSGSCSCSAVGLRGFGSLLRLFALLLEI